MNANWRTACGIVLLVVLAAGTVGSSAAAPPEPRPLSTAEIVENQENETNESAPYPPGVTADGVTNVSALVTAHREALAETGFEYTFFENVSYTQIPNDTDFGNGTTATTATTADPSTTTETTTGIETPATVGWNESDGYGFVFFNDTATEVTENGTVARGLAPSFVVANGSIEYDGFREEYRDETWANGTVVLSRAEFSNQLLLSRIDLVADRGEDPFDVTRDDLNVSLTKADVVNLTLRTGRFEVTKTETVGNRTLFTLEAVEYNGSYELYVEPENVSVYDATVVVDERGRVHRLSFDFVGTEYERVSMHYEFELTHLGPVNVRRPPWTEKLRS